MTNEREDVLDQQNRDGQAGDQPETGAAPVDPWAAAFEAVAGATAAAASPGEGEDAPAGAPADGAEVAAGTPGAEAGDVPVDPDPAGGSVPDGGEPDGEAGSFDSAAVEQSIETYTKGIEEQAITDTAELFMNKVDSKGRKVVRQTDGVMGATISDPDIYRVDPNTGAATFYNPDTGKPFTGDNPRKQAKQWVEDYNEELRESFNRVTEQRKSQLEEAAGPVLELMRFVPTYEKLDNVRQQMLDALIEDYEVYDDAGEHIGYSIDLNKALAQVNKQVAAIQSVAQKKPPTGPAIDMPASGSGSSTVGKQFTSLAEAMEAQQQAQLDKLRNR